MKKKCFIASILLIATMLAGCGGSAAMETPVLLEAVAAKKDTASAEIRYIRQIKVVEANVLPPAEAVHFRSSGLIGDVVVTIGDSVKEGEVLARLDTKTLESTRERLESELEYQLAIHEIRSEQAYISLTGLTGTAYYVTLNELAYAEKSRIEAIDKLEAQLAECLEQIENAELKAPWDGTVLRIHCSPGGYALEAQPAFYITRDGEALLTCEYITSGAYDDLVSCRAYIDGIAYEIEYIPYTRSEYLSMVARNVVIRSRFSINCDNPRELYGKFASVEMVLFESEDTLVVPAGCVQRDAGTYYVNLMQGERQIKTTVSVGLITDSWTEITAGLSEGDVVYVTG